MRFHTARSLPQKVLLLDGREAGYILASTAPSLSMGPAEALFDRSLNYLADSAVGVIGIGWFA